MIRKMICIAAALLMAVGMAAAQDVDTALVGSYYKDTLTTTIDTIDIHFDQAILMASEMSIVAYSTTGADTVYVYAQAMDGVTWHRVDLAQQDSISDYQVLLPGINVPREWILYGTLPSAVRLVCTDAASANVVFIIGSRRVYY